MRVGPAAPMRTVSLSLAASVVIDALFPTIASAVLARPSRADYATASAAAA
jgi:hypothetical protein